MVKDSPPAADRPALRHLDVSRVEHGGSEGVVLTDPLGIAAEQVFVPDGLLPVVGRFDGTRTIAEIERELTEAAGMPLPPDLVSGLARQFEARLLLDGPGFRQALATATEAFLAGPSRPSSHAGRTAGYPGSAAAVQDALDSMVRRLDGPLQPTPRGLVAPHIDLARGREGYSMAYSALAEREPADLYVVFGTGHQGPQAPVTGLPLDWETPLGVVPTDRDFVAAVHARLGAPAPDDLFLHRQEHSLEFQVLFLRHLLGERPASVAGFLCGQLPSATGRPEDEGYVQDLLGCFTDAVEAVRKSGRTVCLVAGADLAHIGPDFGDPAPVDGARLERLATDERARLAHLEEGDPGGFHAAVMTGGNPDRICGGTPMFLTAALARVPAQLLHYGQATSEDGRQTVSFCAMLF